MEGITAVIAVVRALIDAAFGSGGINDATHAELHAQLNAVDPAAAEAERAAAEAASAEETDRAAYEQWKASQQAHAAVAPDAAPDGTESAGFGG